jgi:hypothetical protein
MHEKYLTAPIDQHGRIVQVFSGALDEASDNEYACLRRGLREALRVWSWNRLCQASGARIGPAQVETFGQNNEMAILAAGITNERFGTLQIGRWPSSLNEHLSHANSEFHDHHQS